MGPCQPDECNVHSAIPVKKLFSSITDLVEVINLNRIITWSNHTREKRHPVGAGDVVGAKCFDLYEDVCQLCRNCPLERLFQGGDGFSLERVVAGSDGRQRRRWVRGYSIFDAKNRVVSVLKISFDIDTRREMPGRWDAKTEKHEHGAPERTAHRRAAAAGSTRRHSLPKKGWARIHVSTSLYRAGRGQSGDVAKLEIEWPEPPLLEPR